MQKYLQQKDILCCVFLLLFIWTIPLFYVLQSKGDKEDYRMLYDRRIYSYFSLFTNLYELL